MGTHRFAAYMVLVAVLFVGRTALAVEYDVTETIGDFGTIDQSNVGADCPGDGNNYCVPTATMNSFIYLQNAYPTIYESNLYVAGNTQGYYNGGTFVATPGTNYDTDAGILSGMMQTTPCGGTSYTNWITGKLSYINTYAPGTTYYQGMGIYNAFNPAGVGWITPGQPTAQFLASMLTQGEDVEIWLTPQGGGVAHVMTLASLDFDTVANTGTIDGIDPAGGVYFDYDISVVGGALTFGGAAVDNLDPNSFTNYTLNVALAESPVPEPATLSLLFMSGVAIVARRIRRKAA